ncbi:type II secretion system F family protein [Actinocorallia longicatena]|uniref:Type II secretion system F family protein n=1 Tax=Actinocorallia longicatena TaxID=111803 RepID=A0ABP6QHL3_9ACTN
MVTRHVVLGLVFAGIFLLVVGFGMRRPAEEPDLAQRIDLYRPGLLSRRGVDGEGSVSTALLSLTQRLIGMAGKAEQIAADLARAGWKLQPHEWTLIRGIACLTTSIGLYSLTGRILISVVLGVAGPWLAARIVLAGARNRRVTAFSDQLPDALSMIAGSLRAGFTVSQALERIADSESRPLGTEMLRAHAQTRIGVTIEDALDQVAARMECTDLTWVVMSIRIQREVGGNLADVIETTMDTMRERSRLRRHVRALSAEGRLSAYVLIALPILLTLALMVLKPDYMAPMYTTGTGLTMLLAGAVSMGIGWLWISRMIKIDL